MLLEAPISSLASPLAVSSLRRRTIYCASTIDVTDPSDHGLIGMLASTSHSVLLGARYRAASTGTIRPLSVSVDIVNPAGRGVQWMLLDVPAARLPVLAWAQLGTSGQIDYAAPTIAAPVVFAPSKSLDSWLCTGTAPGALGNYKGVSVAGSQALGAGRALLLVAARLVTGDVYIEGTIRVELEAA